MYNAVIWLKKNKLPFILESMKNVVKVLTYYESILIFNLLSPNALKYKLSFRNRGLIFVFSNMYVFCAAKHLY